MSDVLKVDDSAEALMGEIVDEFTQRLERGEEPEIEDYARRHPRLATVLRQMLPALALLRSGAAAGSVVDAASGDELAPERPLGDYRLVREVGRGGMGVVYEATQLSLGRRVALKVLPFAAALDAKHLQRFKNEAQAAAHLHHKSIVPVHGVGCDRGIHYYAMQFIEGQTLAEVISDLRLQILDLPEGSAPSAPSVAGAEVLRSPGLSAGSSENAHGEAHAGASEYLSPGHATRHATRHVTQHETQPSSNLKSTICNLKSPLTEQSAIGPAYFRAVANLTIQAAEALDCAHEEGVVHRDIKPANLMVDLRGNLWITDFGLAHCQSQAGLTMSGDLVGTLRYMSPEQALAKRVLIDHRTDVYSLGATLYELLTLEPVFPGSDRQELLRQIAFEEPKAPRRHNKSIPAELETIVLKALEKNPADRYATAKELAEDLGRFVKDEPIKARRPSLARRLKGWCRRHNPLVTAITALVVAALLAGGPYLIWQERQRAATAQAVEDDWKEADHWWKEKQWAKALPALERATGRLVGHGLAPLKARVEARRRDAALLVHLELASQEHWTHAYGDRDPIGVNQAYASAFADYGVDVQSIPPEESARRIRASDFRLEMITSLDNWAFYLDHWGGRDEGLHERAVSLRAISQLVDDDTWRRQLRDPAVMKNRAALECLAQGEAVTAQSPENVIILFHLLERETAPFLGFALGPRHPGVRMLLRTQRLHPASFWINLNLGYHLGQDPATTSDAVGFCRAAVALRPQNGLIYFVLGNDFHYQKNLPEAEAAYRKSVELQPKYVRSQLSLARVLAEQGKHAEADDCFRGVEATFREAIKFDYAAKYDTACCAALAGCGREQADSPDGSMLATALGGRFRGLALAALQAQLADWQSSFEKEPKQARATILRRLVWWQQDQDFNGVRGAEALAKLPEAERREWHRLWEEVAELERRAAKETSGGAE